MNLRSRLLFFILIASFFLLNQCASKYGTLARRYHAAKDSTLKTNDIGKWIAVDGYFFEVEEPDPAPFKPKMLIDFPDKAQAAIIKAYNGYDKNSPDFIKSVSTPLSQKPPGGDEPLIDDRTTFKRRLVLTVRNKSFYPADRIWKMYITLTNNSTRLRYSNSSAIATDFETVDVGKLGYTNKASFTSSLTAASGVSASNSTKDTQGSTTGSVDSVAQGLRTSQSQTGKETNKGNTVENKIGGAIGFNNDLTVSEEVLLKQRRVKLSGSVKNNTLSLYQESTSGIDLSGNLIADVELSLIDTENNDVVTKLAYLFSKLLTATAVPAEPKDVEVNEVAVIYPDVTADIVAKISFEGAIRRVLEKDNTIIEADDEVLFCHGVWTGENDVLVLSKRKAIPSFWYLNKGNAPLQINRRSGGKTDLLFRSYEDASEFTGWLKSKAKEVIAQNGKLGSGYSIDVTGLTEADILKLSVRIVR